MKSFDNTVGNREAKRAVRALRWLCCILAVIWPALCLHAQEYRGVITG